VRSHVGALAMRADLTIDAMDDLQLAVEELCVELIQRAGASTARVSINAQFSTELVEVRCALVDVDPSDLRAPDGAGLPESLSQQILDALVDEHGTGEEDGLPVAWLRMSRLLDSPE
jgi:hypothetical protein